MTDERSDQSRSTVALEPRRLPVFWWLVPRRLRTRLLVWRMRRDMHAHRQDMLRERRAQFTLLTPSNRKRVVVVLRTRWDHTGTRLVGVPESEFRLYAEQLLAMLSDHAPDAEVAKQLATFEAALGLRDSPAAHRLAVAAAVRAAIAAPVS